MRIGLGFWSGSRSWKLMFIAAIAAAHLSSGVTPVAFGHQNARSPRQSAKVLKNLCAELLTNPDLATSVDVKGAPGLKILAAEIARLEPEYYALLRADTDAFHPHELVSSARYAKLIRATRGESVLMVPGIENKSIPGFDGVIFDVYGRPVANYSLKTVLTATAEHTPMRRAYDGIKQAKRFSFVERWFVMLKLVIKDESGHFRLDRDMGPRQAREVKRWLSKSMRLFGIRSPAESKRPTRVVVDIQSDLSLPDAHDAAIVRNWVRSSEGLIESVIFMKGDQILEVR